MLNFVCVCVYVEFSWSHEWDDMVTLWWFMSLCLDPWMLLYIHCFLPSRFLNVLLPAFIRNRGNNQQLTCSWTLILCVSFRVWPQTCLLQKHLHPSAMVSHTFTHKCYWYSISCNTKCEREHWHPELDTGLICLFNWLLNLCVFCLFQGRTASSPKQQGWVSHHSKQETCTDNKKKSNFNPRWLWIYVTVIVCFRSSAHRWWRSASPVWRPCTRWRDWWLLNTSTTKAASAVFTVAQISGWNHTVANFLNLFSFLVFQHVC